ncbi:hypothetical protein IQ07DRAFT_665351, partial [Pyrenochaeta sp. DS3sAY3a]
TLTTRLILCNRIASTHHLLSALPNSHQHFTITLDNMFAYKFLAVAALAVAVVAHGGGPENCALASTVTVTVTECVTEPVNPAPSPPGTYAPPPATSVESTATAPHEPEVTPSILPPPRTSEATVVPPTTDVPVVPSSGVVPSGEAPSSAVITPTPGPSSTVNNVRPSSSVSAPPAVSTAGAVLGTPFMNLGSIIVAGAAAVAVVA